MSNGASVSLEAGVWAVVIVVATALAVAFLVAVLRPALHRREHRMCGDRDQLGAHPVEAPDESGVAACRCGLRRIIPVSVRTDTVIAPLLARPRRR